MKGGPGTDDPTHFVDRNFLSQILATALGIKNNQFVDRPEWLGQERFEIVANVPPGATMEQFQEMLRNLLKDRFHLAYHWTKKEVDLYRLVVAKGGSKLKPPAPATGPNREIPPGRSNTPLLDQDGFPQLPAGYKAEAESSKDGTMRMTFRMSSPADFVGRLSRGVVNIVDETGLTGPFDFKLEYDVESYILAVMDPAVIARADARAGGPPKYSGTYSAPDFRAALERQLGLRMEKAKEQIDAVVIDNLDRQPAEN